MPDSAQAAKEYRLGMEAYSRGALNDALGAFDRAISLGDKSWKVLDSKAATLNRMGNTQQAFEIATGLCKRYGDKNARPWYRVAVILSAMGMYEAAERSIGKGLRLKCDSSVIKTFKDLRAKNRRLQEGARIGLSPEEKAQRQAAAKAKMCFTHLLSYDVLILIAQAGLVSDPDFVLRMAGVCTEWRQVMLGYSALWAHLRVGKRRPVQKTQLWIQRNKGRLRELTVQYAVPHEHVEDIALILAPYVSDVERISMCNDTITYTRAWEKKCINVRSIVIRRSNDRGRAGQNALFFGLLHPDACQLESVDIDYMSVVNNDLRLSDLLHNLRSLRKLEVQHLDLSSTNVAFDEIVSCTPALSELKLSVYPANSPKDRRSNWPISLSHLTKLELLVTVPAELHMGAVECPNLQELLCYHWLPKMDQTVFSLMRNLNVTLSKLVVLEFGRRAPATSRELLDILPHLLSLEFLNLPYSQVDNEFVEALVVEAGRPALLPNLSALSLFGNASVSAGPIRRFVLSRNCPEKLAHPTPAPIPKRSAFAPGGTAKARVSSTPVTSTPAIPHPKVKRFNWLCIDNCDNPFMDARVIDSIRPHLRVLLFQHNIMIECDANRVRGLSSYAWNRSEWQEDEVDTGGRGMEAAGLKRQAGDISGPAQKFSRAV